MENSILSYKYPFCDYLPRAEKNFSRAMGGTGRWDGSCLVCIPSLRSIGKGLWELWDLLEQELMTVIAVITHPVGH